MIRLATFSKFVHNFLKSFQWFSAEISRGRQGPLPRMRGWGGGASRAEPGGRGAGPETMANLLSAALPSSDEEDDDYDPTRDLAEVKKREKEELLDGGRGRQGMSGRRTGGLAGE